MERSDSGVLVGALVVVMIAACAAGVYVWTRQPPPQQISGSGFDVAEVDAPPPAPELAPDPGAPAAAARQRLSPAPLLGGLKPVSVGGAPAARGPEAAASAVTEDARKAAERRRREQEFLQKHGPALRQYMGHMGAVTARYYRKYPVVRDVDKAFAAMPRYMEVKRRHGHDPFAFAREATALPEVRAEISKRMKDPQVWRAAIGMMLDTLKQPPPKAVYDAAKDFMTGDPSMVEYLPKAGMEITQNMPAMVQGIPPNADLTPLQNIARDVAPPGLAPPPPGRRRP